MEPKEFNAGQKQKVLKRSLYSVLQRFIPLLFRADQSMITLSLWRVDVWLDQRFYMRSRKIEKMLMLLLLSFTKDVKDEDIKKKI